MTHFTPNDRDRGNHDIASPRFIKVNEGTNTHSKNFPLAEKNRRLVKSQPPHALPHATPDARFAPTTRREQ